MSTVTRERPILFSGPLVRAIIEGRKTQARWVIDWPKLLKKGGLPVGTPCKLAHYKIIDDWALDAGDGVMRQVGCPYGAPGDTLWVRETFHAYHWDKWRAVYKADHNGPVRVRKQIETYEVGKWTPSIHMPRWASRITLRITDVRVERVQDISEEEAIAEGIYTWNHGPLAPLFFRDETHAQSPELGWDDPRNAFQELWDSINAKRGYSWDANPWVWVVTFERVKP